MEVTRIFDLVLRYKKNFKPKDDVLAGKENGNWIKYNIDQYIETANSISYAFLKLGVKKGDKIILSAFGAGYTWGAIYVVWAIDL